mmetsp:Transcript_19816/g.40952  ORF Transcript_19816/g.40952 Transcript_19816/m.40952 type:complete len:136 (-) Transcript_19816:103-510(-)
MRRRQQQQQQQSLQDPESATSSGNLPREIMVQSPSSSSLSRGGLPMSISTTFEVQSGCSADSGHKSFSLLPRNYSGRKKLGVAGCCFLFLLVVIEVSKGRRDGKKHNQTKHTHQTIEKNLECWEQALFVRSFARS